MYHVSSLLLNNFTDSLIKILTFYLENKCLHCSIVCQASEK